MFQIASWMISISKTRAMRSTAFGGPFRQKAQGPVPSLAFTDEPKEKAGRLDAERDKFQEPLGQSDAQQRQVIQKKWDRRHACPHIFDPGRIC